MTRIGYLVNQYPRVSHTFIRREIEGLEALGVEVVRVTVRRAPEELVDPGDRREADRTRCLLEAGVGQVLWALLLVSAASPHRALRALGDALRLGARSGLLRHLGYFAEAALLRTWLQEARVEHLHAHFGTNPAAVALLCRSLGGPPFSFTVHGPEEFDQQRSLGLAVKLHRASRVVAVSDFGRSQLLRLCAPGEWSKIRVVRCGLDDSYLGARGTNIANSPRLVCVGRLCPQKGQLLLLEAAADLVRRGRALELVLVGDGESRHAIETRIRQLGLEACVRITGWADAETVRRELKRARALVLPSFAEGLPVVIMEALALGRPVISTFVAGIPELVVDGESGWLVPAGDLPSLTDAMARVLDMPPAELDRMGREGRRRVLERHDALANARLLKSVIAA